MIKRLIGYALIITLLLIVLPLLPVLGPAIVIIGFPVTVVVLLYRQQQQIKKLQQQVNQRSSPDKKHR